MGRQTLTGLYVLLMAAVIVAVDFFFFRHRLWERLIVNVGIVLVFAAFYVQIPETPMMLALLPRANGYWPSHGSGPVMSH